MFKQLLKNNNTVCFFNGKIVFSHSENRIRTEIPIDCRYTGITENNGIECYYYHCYYDYNRNNDNILFALKTIKKDDFIILEWYASAGNNQYTKEANLFVDYLYLIIKDKKGNEKKYLLAVTVCKNNSAIMIKSNYRLKYDV